MIIVGVSGGVDSMVLLDQLYQDNQKIVVAHVDYQKRSDSKMDAKIIKEYIKDKNIIFETILVDKYNEGNFQAQARQIRYDFYLALVAKYDADAIYLAHHRDDDIETALFKSQRTGLYDYYGIKGKTLYNDVVIKRPLIAMYKEDIIAYAIKHSIPYYEDSSNATLDYTRNIIRADLKKLTVADKECIYQDMLYVNALVKQEEEFIQAHLTNQLASLTFNEWPITIRQRWLFKQIGKYDITIKHLNELIRKIQAVNSFKETILDTTVLKSYDIIYILDILPSSYCYQIKSDDEYQEFSSTFLNKYGVTLIQPRLSYPYIIRNYRRDDFDQLNLDYRKFRSKLKKRHIPFFIRDYLPVVEQAGAVKCFLI